jgi:uncharacterized protein YndB with AHSA1/START domain
MDERIEVTRTIELDIEPGETWELIGDGERWADWMVDASTVEVSPGATGHVIDAGEERKVRIGTVEEGQRVAFDWWPVGRPGAASSVELRIIPSSPGTVLDVVETFPSASTITASVAPSTWTRRARQLSASRRMLVAA